LRFAEAFGKTASSLPSYKNRLEPLPSSLDAWLSSIPEYWERVIVERDVILLDRRTKPDLDIINLQITAAQKSCSFTPLTNH